MRTTVAFVVILTAALAGCGAGIEQLNKRPDKYYQQSVDFRAQVNRTHALATGALLELVDPEGRRILARTDAPLDVEVGQWVKVHGILVPQARVGDRTLYDVVVVERIRRARKPLLAGLW